MPQSSGLFGKQHLGWSKNFCSDETMIPSPDFFAFVPSVFAHQTMDEITHDSGMTLPSTGRNTRIAVPVQISIPILSWCALCQAHQLSAVVANDAPRFTFQIDDFV